MQEQPYMFDSAVPGESLTGELGAKPYENPPQLASVEDVIDFYTSSILDPDLMSQIATQLEAGRKVTDLAEIIVTSSVASGKHTLDVAVLVIPVVMEVLGLVGDMYEVEYDMGTEKDRDVLEEHLIDSASTAIGKESIIEEGMLLNDVLPTEEEEVFEDDPVEEVSMEQSSGLMARR
tara:strand:- start:2908 stop:3438 length:531 start_codon:yes stop_codon:yes gene_type:complete